LIDYIELLDWIARIIRKDKRGAISSQHSKILDALGLDDETCCELANNFAKTDQGAVGSLDELALFASHTGKC